MPKQGPQTRVSLSVKAPAAGASLSDSLTLLAKCFPTSPFRWQLAGAAAPSGKRREIRWQFPPTSHTPTLTSQEAVSYSRPVFLHAMQNDFFINEVHLSSPKSSQFIDLNRDRGLGSGVSTSSLLAFSSGNPCSEKHTFSA